MTGLARSAPGRLRNGALAGFETRAKPAAAAHAVKEALAATFAGAAFCRNNGRKGLLGLLLRRPAGCLRGLIGFRDADGSGSPGFFRILRLVVRQK